MLQWYNSNDINICYSIGSTGIDCCFGNDVYLHKPNEGISLGYYNYSIGSVKACVDNQYHSVCADDVNETIATAMCRSIHGPTTSGITGLSEGVADNIVYPLTPTSLTDISCSGNSFDTSSCNYTVSDCSDRGGEAVITCINGKYHYKQGNYY